MARVQLRDVAASEVAVIRYSGFWSESNYAEYLGKLQSEFAPPTWHGGRAHILAGRRAIQTLVHAAQ